MTKKTFELVARVLRTTTLDTTTRATLAAEFAQEFRAVNPRFDTARFQKACGVD